MPIVDRRELGGRFSVKENAQRLANYRYLEVQLMVWKLDSTLDRLVAVYRVLEPHLVSTYVYHADATDPLTDTPSVRLLRQLAAMGQSHIAWGQAVIASLTRSQGERKRALEVQADIEGRLVECGGVTGQGVESHWLTFHSSKADDKPKARIKRGKGGYRYSKSSPPIDHPVVESPFWFSGNPEDFRRAYQAEDEWSLEGYRHKFHQLLYGEVETTDRMGKMLAEFPELPWEMRMELAHQMWDEARHIEIVAKACEDELGAELGYGPWSLTWWWMQNETDPLKRIAVTNSWSEANLMHMLRMWRVNAEKRGYTRIAELCDYLQADELTHVKLATNWIRKLTENDPAHRDEIVLWGRRAVARIEGFYNSAYGNRDIVLDDDQLPEVHFTFLKPDSADSVGQVTHVIGE